MLIGQEAPRQRQAIATRDMLMPSIDARVRSGIRPASKRLGNVQGESEGVDCFSATSWYGTAKLC